MASIGGGLNEDGLIHLLKTTPLIRKLDLEDGTELTDAVLDCLVPEIRIPSSLARQSRKEIECQAGEQLEHLVISCAMAVTPEAMTRLVRGCKKLRVFEADNTRITGSVMRDFVNRRRHREKVQRIGEGRRDGEGEGEVEGEGHGSEIVGIDCRGVSENAIRDMNGISRPRRGWRGWEARDLQYEDGASVGVTDAITGLVVGGLIGQDECDERRVVVKSFHSWGEVDRVAEQRNKAKAGSTKEKTSNGNELPRWLTNWSLGRRNTGTTNTGTQSLVGTPEEREDRGCIVQ
jgi:F-box/leucine-rich repeat protein 2/20